MTKTNSDLARGSLDLMVLSVLAAGRRYGYLLQQELREASGGLVDMPAGTLYPLLHRLEADKLIKSEWDDETGRRRKWYALTPAGKKRLTQQAHEWHALTECLRTLLAPILNPATTPT